MVAMESIALAPAPVVDGEPVLRKRRAGARPPRSSLLAALSLAAMLLVACTAASAAPRGASPRVDGSPGNVVEFAHAEAVRSGWNAPAPPPRGWVPVELLDIWTTRWPDHDGVVWYRLRWQQADARAPAALLVDYLCMGGAVYVNGSLVSRDASLVEPLSRGWVKPQYFVLDAPLLRAGENTLLVRVSGLAAYQPGFGKVVVGDPAAVRARYARGLFERYQIKLVNAAMSAVLGAIFLLVWLLRREDAAFGWFALHELFGAVYAANDIATTVWPLPSTDAWEAVNAIAYLCGGFSFAMFLLRFSGRTQRWLERAMGAACVLGVAALAVPGWTGPHREPWIIAGALFYYASMGWFLWHAWRTPRLDVRVLAACLLVPVLVSFHDLALFFGLVQGHVYLLDLTSVLTLLGISFVVAHRFVAAMRRVEGFNAELRNEVDAATTKLAQTLEREHALALANTRAGERLQLTRDLHDGFGGTLLGAIAQLEQVPQEMPKAAIVAVLKEMRDDLRLVIDTTTREDADLPALLAPLRHRSAQLLEAAGIDSRWRIDGLDGVDLGGARSLDLLRLLQEALTNAFKHSGARNIEVRVARDADRIAVSVSDDGTGVQARGARGGDLGGGAGFASMHLRARRLGGVLHVESGPAGTALRLAFAFAP
jgi:signal transduction histidine kinase